MIPIEYIAGLFDGEGCFDVEINRDNRMRLGLRIRPYISLGLGVQDAQILDEITEGFPSVSFDKRYVKAKDGGVKGVVIKLHSKKGAQEFIRAIKPYIRLPTNKRRLELLGKLLDLAKPYKRLDDNEVKELWAIVNEIRALSKKKGRNAKYRISVASESHL